MMEQKWVALKVADAVEGWYGQEVTAVSPMHDFVHKVVLCPAEIRTVGKYVDYSIPYDTIVLLYLH